MDLHDLDRTIVMRAGGKAAHLGELSRIDECRVPRGFCVTTDAFGRVLAQLPDAGTLLERLARCTPNDGAALRVTSARLRETIEAREVPTDIAADIRAAMARLGETTPVAVRSSATAEDLPSASFAGLHDSYLEIVGADEVLRHVRRCWASMFTERAVMYRQRAHIDHRLVRMAVVVQAMVPAQAAGVMFTADPVTGNRRVTAIEATRGLGEALVSGHVTPDVFTLRDDAIRSRKGAREDATRATPANGESRERANPDSRQVQSALTDAQVVRLAQLGRRIAAHFGTPQDIEWCRVGEDFLVVQSRPITTLFPIPDASDDEHHVYLSVGHNQMMTDAMKPLGLSFWQMTTPRPMAEAGGRLFVDVAGLLASPASRDAFLVLAGRTDPLVRDALETVLDRGDFVGALPVDAAAPVSAEWAPAPIDADPAIAADLVAQTQASVDTLATDIRGKSGAALLDFIQGDLLELRRILFAPESHRAAMAGMEATWWLNERLQEWLRETHAADALAQAAPHNVTSEMGLALLDVADAIRPHPAAVDFLQRVTSDDFLDGLADVAGGREARDAIERWLDAYGMRGVGEIDITRPRYGERPASLVPLILRNVRHFSAGESARRVAQGLQVAREAEAQLLRRVRALPDGEHKANDVKQMIDRLRTFIGYREYPKFGMVKRTYLYKQALMQMADRLVQAGVIAAREDIFFLRFEELQVVVREGSADAALIRRRKDEFERYRALRPPRVLTSEGEVINGSHRRSDVPAGALLGLPVSAGTAVGRARVVLDIAHADLEPGDILVTPYTDPSWTPFFVAIAGVVTEVGGMMTHGAVIAREYGLPAVVGVADATRLIRDGDWIRVHGSAGYVELVPPPAP